MRKYIAILAAALSLSVTILNASEMQVSISLEVGGVKRDFKEIAFDYKAKDFLKILGEDVYQTVHFIHQEFGSSVGVEASYIYNGEKTKMTFSVGADDIFLKEITFTNQIKEHGNIQVPQLDLSELREAAQKQVESVNVLEKEKSTTP